MANITIFDEICSILSRIDLKAQKKLDGGQLVPKVVNDLLPDFAAVFESFHSDFRSSDSATFESFTGGKERELANSLLAITDGKAAHAKNRVLKKLYYKLRPAAETHLVQSMPPVTRLVDQHVKKTD